MFIVLYLLLGCVIWSTSEDIGGVRPGYCDKGYFGFFCKNECHFPFFGKQCVGICHCEEIFCNFIDGCQAVAQCPDGYTGKLCTQTCAYPYYGQACQKRCLCSKKRCNSALGCISTKRYTEVKIKNELNTDSLSVTSVTPREHSKTTRFSSQTNTTEKCKRGCSQLEDAKDDNSSGFWLLKFSKNRGITISLMVFLALLILSLIGHLVLSAFRCVQGKYLSAFRCVQGKYKSPSLNQASV